MNATVRGVAVGIPVLFLNAPSVSWGSPPPPVNIILIDIDDLGYNDTGPYGEEFAETPALNRLAAEGMRFTNGYSAAPVCSPTRAAVLSGRYGARTGVTDVIVPGYEVPTAKNTSTKLIPPSAAMNLAPDPPTLAEILRRAGYRTAHIGKWHLGDFGAGGTSPAMLGFSEAYDWNHFAYGRWYATSFAGGVLRLLPDPIERYLGWGEHAVPALTERAVAFMERNAEARFFLQLSHYTVHDPLQAKRETIRKYEARLAERGEERSAKLNPHFAAMLEEMDSSVATVLHALDRLALTDETVVIFTSDNGGLVTTPTTRMISFFWEEPWPHTPATDLSPLRAGKGTLYEGGIRVPYVVRWPDVTAPGSSSDAVIHSIDVMPTIAAIAGVPAPELPPDVDGVSFVPILRGESQEVSREAVFWHFPFYPTDYPGFTPAAAIRRGRFKGIYFYEDDRFEVYDLERDVGEARDLSESQPELAASLRSTLRSWQQSVGALHPRQNPAK